MYSTVDICNMSLGFIGAAPIASIDEQRKEAMTCKLYYPLALEQLLREHPWNFAQRKEKLALLETPDVWKDEYHYVYAYPDKCVEIHLLSSSGKQKTKKFTIANVNNRKAILTNIQNAVAEFTYNVIDSSVFDGQFTYALARKLQSLIVVDLLKNKTELVRMSEELYQHQLERAKLSDAQESRQGQDGNMFFSDIVPEWESEYRGHFR